MPQDHEAVAAGAGRQQAFPVGRPGHGRGIRQPFRPQLRFGTALLRGNGWGHVNNVDFGGSRDVAFVRPSGDKGNPLAARRPGRGRVVPIAIRQLHGLAGLRVHHEQVEMAVAPPADGVVTVTDATSLAHLGFVLCRADFREIVSLVIRADVRHRHQAGGVGRPGEFLHAIGQLGQLPRFAAVRRHQPDLALGIGSIGRCSVGAQQRQRCAVRRVARVPVRVALSKWFRFRHLVATRQSGPIHPGSGLGSLGVYPGQHVGALLPIRRDGGAAHGGKVAK